jgi:hypothetical protein
LWIVASLIQTSIGKIVNFEDLGAKSDADDLATEQHNGSLLNTTLNTLEEGDLFLIPNKTFHLMGGIQAYNLTDVTI